MPTISTPATAATGLGLRSRALALFAVMMVIGTLLAPHAAASPGDEAAFVARVNQYRASQGLPALQVDNQLTSLARGWAGQMRDGVCGADNHICHADQKVGVTHDWAKLGENVGTGGDVNSVMDAFIASTGHRNNIVDPQFTHIGVGVVWKDGRLYTTHRFMSLRSSPPATTAAPTTTVAPTSTSSAPATSPATSSPPPTSASTVPVIAPTSAAPAPDASDAAPDSHRAPPASEDRAAIVFDALTRIR